MQFNANITTKISRPIFIPKVGRKSYIYCFRREFSWSTLSDPSEYGDDSLKKTVFSRKQLQY
jgi:hypothetical protein